MQRVVRRGCGDVRRVVRVDASCGDAFGVAVACRDDAATCAQLGDDEGRVAAHAGWSGPTTSRVGGRDAA